MVFKNTDGEVLSIRDHDSETCSFRFLKRVGLPDSQHNGKSCDEDLNILFPDAISVGLLDDPRLNRRGLLSLKSDGFNIQ